MTTESVQELVAARRRWRLTAIALLVVLAAVLLAMPASGGQMWNAKNVDLPYPERVRARTVEAEEIVLKDSTGHVRARLSVQGSAARLAIFDEDGKTIAVLPERARVKELGK